MLKQGNNKEKSCLLRLTFKTVFPCHFVLFCKLESEEFRPVSYSLGSGSATAEPKDMNEFSLPMQNILEEPINLSVKKTQPCVSPPILINSTSYVQSANPKQVEGTKFFLYFPLNNNNKSTSKRAKLIILSILLIFYLIKTSCILASVDWNCGMGGGSVL